MLDRALKDPNITAAQAWEIANRIDPGVLKRSPGGSRQETVDAWAAVASRADINQRAHKPILARMVAAATETNDSMGCSNLRAALVRNPAVPSRTRSRIARDTFSTSILPDAPDQAPPVPGIDLLIAVMRTDNRYGREVPVIEQAIAKWGQDNLDNAVLDYLTSYADDYGALADLARARVLSTKTAVAFAAHPNLNAVTVLAGNPNLDPVVIDALIDRLATEPASRERLWLAERILGNAITTTAQIDRLLDAVKSRRAKSGFCRDFTAFLPRVIQNPNASSDALTLAVRSLNSSGGWPIGDEVLLRALIDQARTDPAAAAARVAALHPDTIAGVITVLVNGMERYDRDVQPFGAILLGLTPTEWDRLASTITHDDTDIRDSDMENFHNAVKDGTLPSENGFRFTQMLFRAAGWVGDATEKVADWAATSADPGVRAAAVSLWVTTDDIDRAAADPSVFVRAALSRRSEGLPVHTWKTLAADPNKAVTDAVIDMLANEQAAHRTADGDDEVVAVSDLHDIAQIVARHGHPDSADTLLLTITEYDSLFAPITQIVLDTLAARPEPAAKNAATTHVLNAALTPA
jgi:hypothetical protein